MSQEKRKHPRVKVPIDGQWRELKVQLGQRREALKAGNC